MTRIARTLLPALLAGALLLGAPRPSGGQEGPPTPGAASCRECHEGPHASWAQGVHARAGVSLKGAERTDESCLSCHAPSGRAELGVSCDTCHGSGFRCGDWNAATAAGRRIASERDCRTCHRESERHPRTPFEYTIDRPAATHAAPREGRDASLDGVYRRFETFGVKDGLPHQRVFAVKTQGATVWAGTDAGLARLRDGQWKSWGTMEGLPHRAVTSLEVEPGSGAIWIGTLGGLARFDGNAFTSFTQENSALCNNLVFGVTLLGDDVWVATFDGISRYNRKTSEWKTYYLENAPLDEVWIYACEAARDRVHFAVWGGGLVEYIPETDHWQAYHDPDGSFELDLFHNDGITSQMSTAASYDNGNVWVSSYLGSSRYDGRGWSEYNEDDSGLASNFINWIRARGDEGWHCTDKGLSVLDLRRRRWVNYRRLEGTTPGTSIEITDLDGRKRHRFAASTPFPCDFIWGIDWSGDDLWIATSAGLVHGSLGTAEDRLVPIEAPPPGVREGAVPSAPAAPGNPPGLVPGEMFGTGFAQKVLGPEYTQPYVFFERPYAIPLAKDFSNFVDPVGRDDRSLEDAPEVRIGFLGCLSGPARSYSEEMLRGAQLALDEINAAGGLDGRPVVLKIRDDAAKMGDTANQTVGLIYEDEVLAFLGSMSSDTTHVAMRVALKSECAELTSISTDPTITQVVVPWVFRCLADDWSQSRALARYVFQERGFRKVALLELNNRYGRMGSAEIKRVAKRMGFPITLAMRYGKTTKDFREHIGKIREYGADAVIIWGLYSQGAQIVRELKEAGIDIPVFGADGLVSQSFIELAGPAAEGVVVTYPFDYYREDPLTQRFNRTFAERYGHIPDSFAAHGYDAMHVLWRAVREAGCNRTRIRDALARTRDFHGVTGMISFDHRGNDMRGVEFAVVHDGQFLPLRMAGDRVRKGVHEK